MANLINSTVSLIAVLLVITATASSAYRTTITTTVDDTNPRGVKEQCREELDEKDMTDCALYMVGQTLEGSEENPQGKKMIEQCCDEIKRVRQECQCDAIKAMGEELQERGLLEKEQYERAMQRAGAISSSCGLRERCDIRSMLF
ncbi:2S seed storage albumin protein-like [Mercurialis annua]|uniref:2S seed storage albumin protein-like n=1 Tax=Mercurialis annua TaxID=3986 RepID=UPI00215DF446|nr:2S seed storage albumin protein-like [Mercurialis annua]